MRSNKSKIKSKTKRSKDRKMKVSMMRLKRSKQRNKKSHQLVSACKLKMDLKKESAQKMMVCRMDSWKSQKIQSSPSMTLHLTQCL